MPDSNPRPDFYLLHARELTGMPETWVWSSLEGLTSGSRGVLVTGACYSLCTTGKRKGLPNWRKKWPDTERKVFLGNDEHDAFRLKWERDTGKCHRCGGTGQEERGWHYQTGTRFGTCARCSGTGKAQQP